MTTRSEILAKARKIKALAERGVEGEKSTAKELFDSYCKKHDINPDEIEPSDGPIFSDWLSDSEIMELCKSIIKSKSHPIVKFGLVIGVLVGSEILKQSKHNAKNEKHESTKETHQTEKAEANQGRANLRTGNSDAKVAQDRA